MSRYDGKHLDRDAEVDAVVTEFRQHGYTIEQLYEAIRRVWVYQLDEESAALREVGWK